MAISWFGLLALAALLYVLFSGLANPRTRPFVIGFGAFVGLGVFLMFISFRAVTVNRFNAPQASRTEIPSQMMIPQVQERDIVGQVRSRAATKNRTKEQAPTITLPPASSPSPAPPPPQSSTVGVERPKMTLLTALRQAIVQAWIARGWTPVAEAPENPVKDSRPAVSAKPQPPAWVNAAPKMEDGSCMMSVRVGPFTTPLECEQKLPAAVQAAVSEYAGISLGPEAAAIQLPNDALKQLVQKRWPEVRTIELDGGSQEMVSLHALVVFDAPAHGRIESEFQHLVIGRRVQGAAVIFAGVLGFLALAWGGLRLATKKPKVATPG